MKHCDVCGCVLVENHNLKTRDYCALKDRHFVQYTYACGMVYVKEDNGQIQTVIECSLESTLYPDG